MRKPVRKATGHMGTYGARRGWTRRAKRFTFGRMSTGIMSGCFIVDKNGLGPFFCHFQLIGRENTDTASHSHRTRGCGRPSCANSHVC